MLAPMYARGDRVGRWIRPRPDLWGLSTAAAGILVLGLLVRLIWIGVHSVIPIADFQQYHQIATTLEQHGVYGVNADSPQAFWPPGWPAALAGLYAITGPNAQLGAMLAAILEWGGILIAAVVAARLLRPPFAVGAVAAMCCYPSAIAYAPVLATEHLAVLLFTALASLMAFTRPSIRISLLAGLLLGALVLTRGDYGGAMAVVTAVWLVRGVDLRRLAVVVAMTALGALVFIAPWTIRNASTFDEFIPTSTNGGLTFYLGTLAPRFTFPPIVQERTFTSAEHPKAHENEYWRLGWDQVKKDPVGWLELDAKRAYYQYGKESTMLYLGKIGNPWIARFTILYWRLIVALALAGFVVLALRWRGLPRAWLTIAGSVLAVSFVKLFFVVNERDRLPLTYLLIVIAGLGAQWIYEELARRRSARRASPA